MQTSWGHSLLITNRLMTFFVGKFTEIHNYTFTNLKQTTMWILYVIGGIFILSLLWHIGFIPEFLGLIALCLVGGGIGALLSYLIVDDSDIGFKIGVVGAIAIYAIYCIQRIVNPTVKTIFYKSGERHTTSERGNGIIGLIVLIASIVYSLIK